MNSTVRFSVVFLLTAAPYVSIAGDIPSDLTAFQSEVSSAFEATRQLKSKQIGFKDFRLGNSVQTDGVPKGTTSCSSQAAFDFSAENMEALRSRWLPLVGTFKLCNATTTVLEKHVSVVYLVGGVDGVIVSITLKSSTEDLPAITAALSKTLGEPKEKIEKKSVAQIREDVVKINKQECDNMRAQVPGASATTPAVQQCNSSVEARADAKMAIVSMRLPREGLVSTTREWLPEGAQVAYASVNTQDETDIKFNSLATSKVIKEAADTIAKEAGSQDQKLKKEEENKRAKDF